MAVAQWTCRSSLRCLRPGLTSSKPPARVWTRLTQELPSGVQAEFAEKLLQEKRTGKLPIRRDLLAILQLGAWEMCQELAVVLAVTAGTTRWGGPETCMGISTMGCGQKPQKPEEKQENPEERREASLSSSVPSAPSSGKA